ncbi:hypothetical protein PROAA_1020008 [Candidatus Propionivibrio aalborgensis]|uniref:Uncharacterized protein n=1 Tax=Candidatus Propionivibrio aalborgensis TaxID=1860101 RepID=A0A1A8XDJ0_9RHOO|nr:hypothetical protein PROAA_1020008 [Candidatus Propionivibrio aalborgensis]
MKHYPARQSVTRLQRMPVMLTGRVLFGYCQEDARRAAGSSIQACLEQRLHGVRQEWFTPHRPAWKPASGIVHRLCRRA